jgi:predicted kinase
MPVRIQLAENRTTKVFSATTIALVSNFDELLKVAAQKFRFKPANVRLFVAKKTISAEIGTELKNNDDFKKIIVDDIMLVVSNKNDFKGKLGKKKAFNLQDLNSKLSFPPRYPFPAKGFTNEPIPTDVTNHADANEPLMKINPIMTNYKEVTQLEMNGIFPIFKGNVLNLIRNAIKNEDKIKEYDCDDYICFDYVDGVTFEDDNAIKRECRGLIISRTGVVLARRFHKFFNINENDESTLENIDFTGMTAAEKLDGSLVSPILLDSGNLIWATRKNRIIEVEQFTASSSIDYNGFVKNQLANNITPLFEWCDNTRDPGMIHYFNKQLVLLAMRHNETGEYLSTANTCNIPVAMQYDETNISKLFNSVKSATGREGVVVSLPSGNKYKLKSMWYVHMVQANKYGGVDYYIPEFIKLRKTIKNIPSDKIWFTALQNNDDVISLCMTLLEASEASNFRSFVNSVQKSVKILESELISWVNTNASIAPDVDAISSLAELAGWPDWLVSDIAKKVSISDKLKHLLISYSKQHNTNILEEMLDIKWNIDLGCLETVDDVLNIIKLNDPSDFGIPDNEMKNHIITKYFPKKLSNFMGMKHIYNDTIINISDKYVGDEGKIIGMWEKFTQYDVYDLRVDLQPSKKGEFTDHYGNYEYALFLVQYGLFNNASTKPHGCFAGIMVPTNCNLTYDYLVKALENSFNTHRIVKIKRHSNFNSKLKIFCDLDGVLADFDKGVRTISGLAPEMQSVAKMWQRINNYPKFFESLDWTSYGKHMWDDIVKISQTYPTILTGVPPKFSKTYSQEKRNWCQKHLDSKTNVITSEGEINVSVITCLSAEKYKYSSTDHVLIDDNLENGKKWSSYGGIFIHHISYERTIYELKRLYKQIDKYHFDDFETEKLDDYKGLSNPTIITEQWIKDINFDQVKMIAIDSEWDPNTGVLSIIQLAIGNKVYIIDMLNTNDMVKDQLANVLTNANIVKVFFSMDSKELARIGSDIRSAIDLQEVIMSHYDIANNLPSLNKACASILNKNLNKTKELQAGNWSMRPLEQNQLQYASDDVTVLIKIYEFLRNKIGYDIPPKNIYCSKDNINKNNISDDLNVPVNVVSCCIFLTENSQKELLNKFKPKYKHVYGKEIVVKKEPTEYELRGVPIGNNVAVKLLEEINQNGVQSVICEYNNKFYEILISSDIADGENNSIKPSGSDVGFGQVFGTVGLIVEDVSDPLASLPERIKDKITSFAENCLDGSILKFKPDELSASERSTIHEYAKNCGMITESTGPKNSRKLILKVKRKNNIVDIENDTTSRRKIVDPYYFSLLKICSKDANIAFDGHIDGKNIHWVSDKYKHMQSVKNMIILRGLPGSGKSHVANHFKSLSDTSVCSADNYFIHDGVYEFDKEELSNAHAYCYNSVKKSIDAGTNTIVVDNVNCKLSDYKKYLDVSDTNGYKVIVIEIFCENKQKAVEFAKRSSHNVPIKDVLKILSQWETDDSALLLESHMCDSDDSDNELEQNDNHLYSVSNLSFNKWLSDMGIIHNNKQRRKTHISFGVGQKPIYFLDVPDHLYDEFLEHYANSNEHKYLTEVIPSDGKFKMFIDIDYSDQNKLTENEILNIIHILQKQTVGDVYVTGCMDGNKIGLHVRCPNLKVDIDEAIGVRNNFVANLYEVYPDKNWDAFIDSSVYMHDRGLRMFGSRKANNGIDIGRVYNLLFHVDALGKENIPDICDIDLLKAVSLHDV